MSELSTGAAVPPTSADTVPPPTRRAWLGLAVILLAAFMELLDVTVVTVASPEIQNSFRTSYAQVQWILAGYQLTFAAGLVAGGRLGDIFGCRRVFGWGVLAFAGASLLCGVATSGTQIVLFRLLQGLAAAVMFPQVQAIIHVTFTGKHRAAAFGALGGVTGLAGMAGPLLGGMLVDLDLFGSGWRMIFLINIPVGVIAAIGAKMLVDERRSARRPGLDPVGTLLGTGVVALVVFPLIQGRDANWAWWIWVLLALTLPAMGLFLWHQRSLERRGGWPVVDPALFRGGSFGLGLVVQFFSFAGISAFFLVLAVQLQAGYQWSALHTGLAFLPVAIGTGLASGIAIPLMPRMGKRLVQAGALVMALGMVALMMTLSVHPTGLSVWTLTPAGLVVGLGLGLVVTTVNDVVLAEAVGPSAGSAAGVKAMVGQSGNAAGVAVLGALFFGLLSGSADGAAQHELPAFRAGLTRLSVSGPDTAALERSMTACVTGRARTTDRPSPEPGCAALAERTRAIGDPAVARLVDDTLTSVRQRHFSDSMRISLGYEVTVYGLVFLLVFLLPLRRLAPGSRR